MRFPLLLALVALGCAPAGRDAADRTPPTADCDPGDPTRCLLPWPSNAFATEDASTATGLRLAVQPDSLLVDDRLDCLTLADGFSRVTGVAVGVEGAVDPGVASWDPAASLDPEAPLQLVTIQHDHPAYGTRRALRTELRTAAQAGGERTLILGRPAELLPEAADHAVVLLDTVGGDRTAPRAVRVALGLDRPDTEAERERAWSYAPVADALVEAGVDLERVLRVSWFTTRSRADTTRRLRAMVEAQRAAVADAALEIDAVEAHPDARVAAVVRARLVGMPAFLDDEDQLAVDEQGLPRVTGTRDVRLRVVLPADGQPYKVALFGHGTGGDYTDEAFDEELAGAGIAKTSVRFDGWTGETFVGTALGMGRLLEGSGRSTARLTQALSAAPAVLDAFEGELGDLLAAQTLGDAPNPMAGVRPDLAQPAWLGGSLGGTMGPVVVGSDPRLELAVFNVPGAGWTHLIPYSYLYELGLSGVVEANYPTDLDLQHNLVMAQACWDDVDGAVWADEVRDQGTHALLQESLGDPVLPNIGTELLAASLQAVHLDPTLEPIHGLERSAEPLPGGIAITQFRVPDEGPYPVHGFADRDTPAGDAAIGQITTFLQSAWDGAPVLAHPEGCDVTADGSCDFGEAW